MKNDDVIMLDDFLLVMREKVSAIKVCDNNPHVLVYIDGIPNPFRLKCNDKEASDSDLSKWALNMFESLQCEISTGFLDWEDYRLEKASDKAVDDSTAEIRHITDIVMDENSESVNVIVQADKNLVLHLLFLIL